MPVLTTNQDPRSSSILRRSHAHLQAASVVCHLGLFVLGILLRRFRVMFALSYLLLNTLLAAGWIALQPIHSPRIQDTVAGFAMLPFWAGICYLMLECDFSRSASMSRAMTLLLVIGAVPAVAVGSLMSRSMRSKIALIGRRLVSSIPDEKQLFREAIEMYDSNATMTLVDKLQSFFIEIAARSFLGPNDYGIELAISTIRRGIIRYPQSGYLRVQNCWFLLRARNSDAASAAILAVENLHLDKDQAMRLTLLRREAAFIVRAQQLAANGNSGHNSEAFDEAELKIRLAAATRLYVRCQILLSQVWAELLHDSIAQEEGNGRRARRKKSKKQVQAGGKRIAAANDDDEDDGGGVGAAVSNDMAGGITGRSLTRRLPPLGANGLIGAAGLQSNWTQSPGFGGGKLQLPPLAALHKLEDVMGSNLVKVAGLDTSSIPKLSSRSFGEILNKLEQLRKLECDADAAFEFLLTQCPESPEVLQEYAVYVRGVKLDDSRAREYESRRDMAVATREAATKRDIAAFSTILGAGIPSMRKLGNDDNDVGSSSDDMDMNSSSSSGASSSEEAGRAGHRHRLPPLSSPSPILGGGSSVISQQPYGKRLTSIQDAALPASLSVPAALGGGGRSGMSSVSLKNGSGERVKESLSMNDGMHSDAGGDEGGRTQDEALTSRSNNDDDQGSFSSADSSRSFNDRAAQKDRADIQNAVAARVATLKLKLRVSTMVLVLLCSGLLFVFIYFADQGIQTTTDTDFGGGRRSACATIAAQTRRMHVAAINNDQAGFASAALLLSTKCLEIGIIHSELAYRRTFLTARLESFYHEANVKVREIRDFGSSEVGNENLDIVGDAVVSGSEAMERMISAGMVIANTNMTMFRAYNKSVPSTFPSMFFVLDNAVPIMRAMDTATLLTVLEVDSIIFTSALVNGALSAAAFIIECIIILAMFRPAVHNMFLDLGMSVNRLAYISRTDRAVMTSRFRAVREQNETDAINQRLNDEQAAAEEAAAILAAEGGGPEAGINDKRKKAPEQTQLNVRVINKPTPNMPSPILRGKGGQVSPRASSFVDHSSNQSAPTLSRPPSNGNMSDISIMRDERGAAMEQVNGSAGIKVRFVGSHDGESTNGEESREKLPSPLGKDSNEWSPDQDGFSIEEGEEAVVMTVGNAAKAAAGVAFANENKTKRAAAARDESGSSVKSKLSRDASQPAAKQSNGQQRGSRSALAQQQQQQQQQQQRGGRGVGGDSYDAAIAVDPLKPNQGNDAANTNQDGKSQASQHRRGHGKHGDSMSAKNIARRALLIRWYMICLFVVSGCLIVVFVLSYVSTGALSGAARRMNNLSRRIGMMEGMSWLTYEFMSCFNSTTGLCGGLQRVTSSEKEIRCYFNEMVMAAKQVHTADLNGAIGWEKSKRELMFVSDPTTPCSSFTDQVDLHDISADLGIGSVRSDPRMRDFMYLNGECLATPSTFSQLPSLTRDKRTALFIQRFSDAKCVHFNAKDSRARFGLNRMIDDVLLNYHVIAFSPIRTATGELSLPDEEYDFVEKYVYGSEELALGMLKGNLLLEATAFDQQTSDTKVVSIAFAALMSIAIGQLFWLGSRVHKAIEDNMLVELIVQRMLRMIQQLHEGQHKQHRNSYNYRGYNNNEGSEH